uniref:Uncharacterized protein n=1 Tax=Trypanosoma vivax (strain Y486) TaxID=1055687 RepID=G0UCP2_TRYVY|nr:hypothetical protein TVY486_1110860 [Trypanosoma vivax Y486]
MRVLCWGQCWHLGIDGWFSLGERRALLACVGPGNVCGHARLNAHHNVAYSNIFLAASFPLHALRYVLRSPCLFRFVTTGSKRSQFQYPAARPSFPLTFSYRCKHTHTHTHTHLVVPLSIPSLNFVWRR